MSTGLSPAHLLAHPPFRARAYPQAWSKIVSSGFTGPWSQNAEELALFEQFYQAQTDGVFVEMGALDGRLGSNTIAFESVLNWTGVLIEANPDMCMKLKRNRPKATVLCTATSADSKPVTFQRGRYSSTFGEQRQMDASFRQRFSHVSSPEVSVPSAPLGYLLRMTGLSCVQSRASH